MKEYLENLRKKYETKDFIKNDPILFPHLFKGDIKNLEIMGFIASVFAYGKREAFIGKLNLLLEVMRHRPYDFILNFDKNEDKLNGFIYRFYKDSDIKALFFILSEILKKGMTLGDLFYENRHENVNTILQNIFDTFQQSKYNPKSQGFSFMMSNPKLKGANKRMNMFLRWMVRGGPVDFGVWNFIEKKNLIIPLDVHVGRISRELKLLERKQNDFLSAWNITQKLKEFDENDPVKFDFALFGAGVNKNFSQGLIK